MPPSHTLRIIYVTSVKQWISGPHLQFVSSWQLLTFSDVMNDSLFGVFCHNYFVNTTMHHDWSQLRFPLLPNCQPKCQRFTFGSLWDVVVALGITGFCTFLEYSLMLYHHFHYVYWEVWKLTKHLFLYCTISLAIWQHTHTCQTLWHVMERCILALVGGEQTQHQKTNHRKDFASCQWRYRLIWGCYYEVIWMLRILTTEKIPRGKEPPWPHGRYLEI